MKDNWLDDIEQRFSFYEVSPPEGLWQSVSSKLRTSKRASRPWIWAGGIALAAGLALLLFLPIFNFKHADTHEVEPRSVALYSSSQLKFSTDLKKAVALVELKSRDLPKVVESTSSDEMSAHTPEDDDFQVISDVLDPEIPSETIADWSKEWVDDSFVASQKEKHKARFAMNLYGSANAGSSHLTKSINGGSNVMSLGSDGMSWKDNPKLGLAVYNQGREVETILRHRMPSRIGISLSYYLNDRFSIVSGLSYTLLLSEYKEGTSSDYKSGEQKLDYIGIPLSLKYDFYSSSRLDVYALGGIVLDKCIKSIRTDDYYLSGENRLKEIINLGEYPFQFSTGLSVGTEYRLYSGIWTFFEGGLSYFLSDNSNLNTLYKERPLNLNLNLGIRFIL